ncbi:MAG: hypothetical protein OXN16_02755 [Gammaproteobacteria bacterium]|nr:hypothetical protein [Gammaproteobacteria bacterium]
MISLQDAVDDLYRIAVTEKKLQSPKRLALLAEMCVEQLDQRGIVGAAKELDVPGIGRSKSWDVGWPADGKVRLGISLKSLLRNIAGTVPNRVDDLTGEMANVQLLSPEIVTGYIMIFDTTGSGLRQDGTRWVDFFRDAVNRLSGRDAPAWAAGMVEASAIVEVDFSETARIVAEPDMSAFFDRLAQCVHIRNPDMFRETC